MEPRSDHAPSPSLPHSADLTPQHIAFLDQHFPTHHHNSTQLHSSLSQQCSHLHSHLHQLHNRLTKRAVSWISRSFQAKSSLHHLTLALQNLSLRNSPHAVGSKRFQWVLNDELPRLANEIKGIESIRFYLETTIQFEALVGDLEDASLFVMACHTGNVFSAKRLISSISKDNVRKHDKLLQSIKAMNDIEEVLVNVQKYHPQWHCLMKSVDVRVDKILAALRPHVLADHRALLTSLGWPPNLLPSKNGSEEITGVPNPLVLMQEDKRIEYSQSFIALCSLQHIQTGREGRLLNCNKQNQNIELWPIDELVAPIASRMEYHFNKWTEHPEYMFALVYKVTSDFISGVDDVLQPLIDKARLSSCSAKEAWVSAMVRMLSGFLIKKVFPLLAERYKVKHMKHDAVSSWLHLIDLIVTFDKQMQSLVNLDICFLAESERFEGLSRGISVLSIFSHRHDWLKIWAKIELKNSWKKLNTHLKEEKAWRVSTENNSLSVTNLEYLLSTIHDHKAPPIAELSIKILWEVIERCKTMPSILLRVQFIRSTAGRLLWYFFKILLLQFKATDLSLDNSVDVNLVRVCGLINSARYIWIKLQEWSDNVDFLEMNIAEKNSSKPIEYDVMDKDCFYGDEMRSLSEMETNWLLEIIVIVLRQFEMLSLEYFRSNDKFVKDLEHTSLVGIREAVDLVVSMDFVEALDALKSQLHIVRVNLNTKDLLDFWRSIAEGLDHYVSRIIISSEIQFSEMGINQFEADMHALIFILKPYCARPQAFFPCITEILKLLKLKKEEVKLMQVFLSNDESGAARNLHCYGVSHLSVNQVLLVLRSRRWHT